MQTMKTTLNSIYIYICYFNSFQELGTWILFFDNFKSHMMSLINFWNPYHSIKPCICNWIFLEIKFNHV